MDFEREPAFNDAAWSSLDLFFRHPASKYLLIAAIILAAGLLILNVRKSLSRSRGKKVRLARALYNPKAAILGILLVGMGGLLAWNASAKAPKLMYTSWSHKVPLRVYDKGTGVDIPAIVKPWNTLAERTIFTVSSKSPHIVFVKGPWTWVDRQTNLCTIYVGFPGGPETETMQHEIGHCLGFADHVKPSHLYGRNDPNAPVCKDEDHPQYWPYVGVMSYCDWGDEENWWGRDDSEGMRMANYMADSRNPYYCPHPHPLLKLGMKGNCVRHLQWNLVFIRRYHDTLGSKSPLYFGPIDGIFGERLKKAVQAYETLKKYKADGVVGSTLWRSIHGACTYITIHPKYSKTQPAGRC